MIRRIIPLLILSYFSIQVFADLPVDKIGKVETLPGDYPDSWVFVHDVSFMHMSAGKHIIMDLDGKTMQEYYKGTVNSSFISMFANATTKPEFYVADNYYERGTRGKRTDVVTFYDKKTLTPLGEVILEDVKRAEMLPSKYTMRTIDKDNFLLLYKFNPATVIAVIDTNSRKVVNNIHMPTCAGIYPTGKRGFSSICSNGSMISYQLDDKGQVSQKKRINQFFNVDEDPLFEKPALINQTAYFPTFQGKIQEIDLSGQVAKPGMSWDLVTGKDSGGKWRPGGAWPAAQSGGNLYVLMHENGYEGSHKDPGSEIWVYDVSSKKRINRITLKMPAIAFDISTGKNPRIITTNIEMGLEIYSAGTGEHIRNIDDFYRAGPLLVYASP